MISKNRISAATVLAAASLTFSPAAWSLGLGDITVESFLNQPLQVKIDLISRETDDMKTVTARLASAEDYQLIGANRDDLAVPVRFTIEDIDGDAYLTGSSNLPVGNPVVRLIVEVNWSKGRLLREYTVFLDPPTYTELAPLPRTDDRKSPPASEPAPEASAVAQAEPSAPARAPARQPVDGEYGPVSSGQTLSGIASDWSRGTGMNLNKVMIAIQRENPEAFLRNNINLLKRGAILRMPAIDDVNTIATSTANSEVSAQTDEFRGGRTAELAASADTPLLAEETAAFEEEEAVAQADMGAELETEVEADIDLSPALNEEASSDPAEETVAEELAAEDTAAEQLDEQVADSMQEPVEAGERLELVPPSENSELDSAYGFEETESDNQDASVAVSSLRENLARTEEDLITQQQQNEYLAERIRELETELTAAQDTSVNNEELASMEQRLREERRSSSSEPWYSRFGFWLIGLLVLAAGLVGWLFSRRGGDEIISTATSASEEEQIRGIKDEAEEVLRVLEDPQDEASETDSEADSDAKDESEAGDDEKPATPEQDDRASKRFGSGGDDAELLDEESSDPEIQLDLARAYISMGDKEAARVILEEVGNNGSEAQQEEARKMLNLLVP
jgi:pilus assembly protein FimV